MELKGILPKEDGQVREMGAVLGQKNGVPVRLIMLRVPERSGRRASRAYK